MTQVPVEPEPEPVEPEPGEPEPEPEEPVAPHTFTITFDLNDDRGIPPLKYPVTGESIEIPNLDWLTSLAQLSGIYGYTFDDLDYAFTGWNTERDGTGTDYQTGGIITETVTLYAQWEVPTAPGTFVVMFDSNGGDHVPPIANIPPGAAITAPSPSPARYGYTFDGWYKEAALTAWDFAADTVTGNITLHAKWNPILVTSVTLQSTSLNLGESEQLIYSIQPENALNQNVSWNSGNSSVATVNNGIVTAVGVGTATITVATLDGSNKTAACTVTVNGIANSIVITPWVNEQNGTIVLISGANNFIISGTDSFTVRVEWDGIDTNNVFWYLGGSPIGEGPSITINATDYNPGTYQLMVMVYKDDKPYSAEISFTVEK